MNRRLNRAVYVPEDELFLLRLHGMDNPQDDPVPETVLRSLEQAWHKAQTKSKRNQYGHLLDMLMFEETMRGWPPRTCWPSNLAPEFGRYGSHAGAGNA